MRFYTLALVLVAAALVAADEEIECPTPLPGSGLCSGVPPALTAGGLEGATQVVPEGPLLTVLSSDDSKADLLFDFIYDGGDYDFCFGFCLRSGIDDAAYDAVTSDLPATDAEQLEFAKQCISADPATTYAVFNDTVDAPGAQNLVEGLILPAQVIFFILPDNRIPEFLDDPDAFWADEDSPRPLFSLSGANPGCKDQLVLYEKDGEEKTLFIFEDITRAEGGGSDEDFGDLVFSVDAIVEPLVTGATHYCEPGSDYCTEASIGTTGLSVTMSWGADGSPECDQFIDSA